MTRLHTIRRCKITKRPFLVACTRLYKPLCRSVRRSVRRPDGPSPLAWSTRLTAIGLYVTKADRPLCYQSFLAFFHRYPQICRFPGHMATWLRRCSLNCKSNIRWERSTTCKIRLFLGSLQLRTIASNSFSNNQRISPSSCRNIGRQSCEGREYSSHLS